MEALDALEAPLKHIILLPEYKKRLSRLQDMFIFLERSGDSGTFLTQYSVKRISFYSSNVKQVLRKENGSLTSYALRKL